MRAGAISAPGRPSGTRSEKDGDGNCEVGDVLSLNGSGNYINAGSRMVAAVGLENMVVVETKDTVFVAPKNELVKSKA